MTRLAVELFAGLGGFALAAHANGIEVVTEILRAVCLTEENDGEA